jgi:hypothetical protein
MQHQPNCVECLLPTLSFMLFHDRAADAKKGLVFAAVQETHPSAR